MELPETTAQSSRGIIILGMHRSGTSAITRGVQALGAYLGDNLLEARFDNPTGYWEDKAIVDLHDRLLDLQGMTWEDWQLIDDAWWVSAAVSLFVTEARHYLVSQFLSWPLWAFKDPRTLRMLPLWSRVLGGLDVDIRHLLVIRNPLSVVESLYRRQSMDRARAHCLWLAYVVPHLARVLDSRLTVVDYDLFMSDPRHQLRRIAEGLQLGASCANAAATEAYLTEFLQPEMRHVQFDDADLACAPEVPAVSREAYLWLRRLATDDLAASSPALRSAWTDLATRTQSVLEAAA
jgi:hypothetical protein